MAGKDFVGIALCGLGRMGSIHLPNILKNGRGMKVSVFFCMCLANTLLNSTPVTS